MPNDALTTALIELGLAYELAVQVRKQSADVQTSSLAMEQAMWRCLNALRRLTSNDGASQCIGSEQAESR